MTVRTYFSTDPGAPALSGTAGALLGVLDACLIDGYGQQTLDSLTQSGGTATATVNAGHGFTMRGNVGPVIRIAGADQADYNGDHRITVTSTTQFTFPVASGAVSPATGAAITAKRAPAGWTKPFSGTNLAVYRSNPALGTGYYWRVDDNAPLSAREARTWGYETMTSVTEGSNIFPNSTQSAFGRPIRKASDTGSTARPWQLIADEATFYLFIETGDTNVYFGYGFGDYQPMPGLVDAYRVFIAGRGSEVAGGASLLFGSNNITFGAFSTTLTHTGIYLARNAAGTVVSLEGGLHAHAANAGIGVGVSGETYPHPIDNALHLSPVFVHSGGSYVRGQLRGVWCPRHAKPFAHLDTFEGAGDLAGRVLQAFNLSNNGQCLVEISNTWPTSV